MCRNEFGKGIRVSNAQAKRSCSGAQVYILIHNDGDAAKANPGPGLRNFRRSCDVRLGNRASGPLVLPIGADKHTLSGNKLRITVEVTSVEPLDPVFVVLGCQLLGRVKSEVRTVAATPCELKRGHLCTKSE